MTKMIEVSIEEKIETPWIEVSLYVRGDNLDPQMITNRLGVKPTKSSRKGDIRYTHIASGRHATSKLGVWSLSSREYISTSIPSIETHTETVLSKFSKKIDFYELEGVDDVELDIFVIAKDDNNVMEKSLCFEFSSGSLKTLIEMGARISVSIV